MTAKSLIRTPRYASTLQLFPRNELNLRRLEREGNVDVRWNPLPSRCPVLRVSATGAAAASPEDFSSQASQKPPSWGNPVILSSVSEFLGKPGAAEDDKENDNRVEKTTTVVQLEDSESGAKTVVQEYELTEEGTLSTVKVTRGGITKTTYTKLDRVIADLGIQVESLQQVLQNFSVRQFIKDWGKKEPGLEDLKLNASFYASKEGVSNISQWTATELTLQRAQMVRIARDTLYLICAFSLFGAVRILEAVASVFATSPPNFWKLMDGMNAMDPLTIASLAHGLRKPVVGMLEVDPTNLEEVSSLKAKFWAELHKFYERQWKVMGTLGVARLFALIVTHLPSAEWVTSKAKVLWDVTMALPLF